CADQGLDRVFCTNCGSRVVTNNLKDGSGIVYVQEGTLDRLDEWFPPQAEIFTWSRQPWMRPLDLPQLDHGSNCTRATHARGRADLPCALPRSACHPAACQTNDYRSGA